MPEILVQFDEPRNGSDRRSYIAQVYGQLAADDLWEAWIEFVPTDGGDPIRTGRETEQFTRGDLRYWAARLTGEYLDQAIARALAHTPSSVYYAPELPPPATADADEQTLFDPFALYRASGVYTLRQALRALNAKQLQNMIGAYAIPAGSANDTLRTFEDALAEQIVAEVQQRVGSSHPEEVRTGAQTP